MNDESRLIHFKHYTENSPELENATSKIDIITKALKTPISVSNQLDVYEGRAALLADRKMLNKSMRSLIRTILP